MQVSVIIPVYNAEKYLSKCLDSVVNQTFRDFEIIIVDDGSTDASGEICDRYAERYMNVMCIHKKNDGAHSARKDGMRKAKGKYIAFVDADDWVEDNYLEMLIENMQKNDADIVISGCIKEKNNKSELCVNNIKQGIYSETELSSLYQKMLHFEGFYEFGIQPYLWNKLFIRDLLLKHIEGMEEKIYDGEDVAIVFPYLLEAKKIVIIEECLYHYRYHENSITYLKGGDFYENVSRLYLYLKRKFCETVFCESMLLQLDQYMRMMIWLKDPGCFDEANNYVFPFDKIPKGADIVLYAAGRVGRVYFKQIQATQYCNIVAWVDKAFYGNELENMRIIALNDIKKKKFDYIVIAVGSEFVACTIKKELIELEIEEKKIVI